MEETNLTVLIGHQRSGTNFVNDLLQSSGRVESVNEPFSMFYSSTRTHPDRALRTARSKQIALQLRRWAGESPRGVAPMFKETCFIHDAQSLRELFPRIRAVVVTREPANIVAAIMRIVEREQLWNLQARIATARNASWVTDFASPEEQEAYELARMVIDAYRRFRRVFPSSVQISLEALLTDSDREVPRVARIFGETDPEVFHRFIDEYSVDKGGRYSTFRRPEHVLTNDREMGGDFHAGIARACEDTGYTQSVSDAG